MKRNPSGKTAHICRVSETHLASLLSNSNLDKSGPELTVNLPLSTSGVRRSLNVNGIGSRNENGPPIESAGRSFFPPLRGAILILAVTYVPTQLPVQYHRPCGA